MEEITGSLEETKDRAFDMLEIMAKKLGTTTEYLWKILVKQAYVNAIWSIIQIAALFPIFLVLQHVQNSMPNVFQKDHDTETLVMCIAWLFYGMYAIASTYSNLEDFINGFFNPEYWALNQLTNQIKHLTNKSDS